MGIHECVKGCLNMGIHECVKGCPGPIWEFGESEFIHNFADDNMLLGFSK